MWRISYFAVYYFASNCAIECKHLTWREREEEEEKDEIASVTFTACGWLLLHKMSPRSVQAKETRDKDTKCRSISQSGESAKTMITLFWFILIYLLHPDASLSSLHAAVFLNNFICSTVLTFNLSLFNCMSLANEIWNENENKNRREWWTCGWNYDLKYDDGDGKKKRIMQQVTWIRFDCLLGINEWKSNSRDHETL